MNAIVVLGFALLCVIVLAWAFRKAKEVEDREAAQRGHFSRNPLRGSTTTSPLRRKA